MDIISSDTAAPGALQEKVDGSIRLLQQAVRQHGRVVYASSLGAESAVLTELIHHHAPGIDIFTVDTGRLHEQSLELLERIERRYARRIRVVFPDAHRVQNHVEDHGINGFRQGLRQRQACCHVRKVEPFQRAIAGYAAWVSGLRHDQSAERGGAQPLEFDARYRIHKINPLLSWNRADVWAFIRAHELPYNPLHDAGYPSIGCLPCTRAVEPGEDERAGRWWWEAPGSRECGLQPRQLPQSLSDL
jgi:phosphoadenosine phosphosulfate reductase